MAYLFVFRSAPDIDHIAPLAWKLIQRGETVHGLISPGCDPRADHRLRFLLGFERFRAHEVQRPGRFQHVASIARGTVAYPLWLLLRHRIGVVGVEWGYGLPAGYDALRSPRGWVAVTRSAVRSAIQARRRDAHQPRTNAIVAARLAGRPVVCLPHGLNIKLDAVTNEASRIGIQNGTLDYADRNRFAVYVTNTCHHREFQIEYAGSDPEVVQAWGSTRWDPEWFALNRRLVGPWAWPAAHAGTLKVVLMVPKWHNRVDAPAVIDLVARLQDLPYVSLAIKGHPRPEAGQPEPLRDDPRIRWDDLHHVGAVDSVALIDAADVILDVGSSIGIEVVMQGNVLINPTYLHGIRTLFDDIPGSCVVARDAGEVIAALESAAAGSAPVAAPAAVQELLRRAVYADRPEPFEVLGYYADRFRQLAASG